MSSNTQFVLSSTGVDKLASNGSSNQWALYGVPALHAAMQLQVCFLSRLLGLEAARFCDRMFTLQPLHQDNAKLLLACQGSQCERESLSAKGPYLHSYCLRTYACLSKVFQIAGQSGACWVGQCPAPFETAFLFHAGLCCAWST